MHGYIVRNNYSENFVTNRTSSSTVCYFYLILNCRAHHKNNLHNSCFWLINIIFYCD